MLATGDSSCPSAMKSAGAIGENSAMGYIAVVVEHHSMTAPVGPPVPPAPAKPAEKANSKAESKCNARAANVQSRIRIPSWPYSNGRSIHEPRVIFRHVNDIGIGWVDHNGLAVLAHLFLRCALLVARLLCAVAHCLNRIHHVLLLVDVSIAERRRPGEILVHVGEH